MSGVMSVMRVINLVVGGAMIALAIGQILSSDDAFSVMADALTIIYTMYAAACEGYCDKLSADPVLGSLVLAFLRSS